MEQKEKVLEINNLKVQFKAPNNMHYDALKGISFDIYRNEIFGLIGESGSGKSTTAKAILGLVDHSAGSIKINNELVPNKSSKVRGKEQVRLARKVQMIFQDAKSSLNPRETVYKVVVEGAKNMKLHKQVMSTEKLVSYNNWLSDHPADSDFGKYISSNLKYEETNKSINDEYDPKIWSKYREIEEEKLESDFLIRDKKTYLNSLHTQLQIDKYRAKMAITQMKAQSKDNEQITPEMIAEAKESNKKQIEKRAEVYKQKKEQTLEEIKELKSKKKDFTERISILKKELSELKSKKSEEKKSAESTLKSDLSQIDMKSESFKSDKLLFEEENKIEGTNESKSHLYERLVSEALQKVSISAENMNRYPQEFSGGQAQRIAIARTLMTDSKFVIADEPISALDVSIQAQVINILKGLVKDEDITIMFIAHDLQVVKYISDRIAVLYKGELVEKGDSLEVYNNPIHPYTKMLINAVPKINDPNWMDKAESYTPESFDDLLGDSPEKQWHDVNDVHQVHATKEEFDKWISVPANENEVVQDDEKEVDLEGELDEPQVNVSVSEEISLDETDEIEIDIEEERSSHEEK